MPPVLTSAEPDREPGDAGAVTVEAALGICSVVSVFALALAGSGVLIGQLRCTDAAVEAARLVARGAQGRAPEAVRLLAPEGAELDVTIQGDRVTTEVSSPEPIMGFLPAPAARAHAVLEPGTASPPGQPSKPEFQEAGSVP